MGSGCTGSSRARIAPEDDDDITGATPELRAHLQPVAQLAGKANNISEKKLNDTIDALSVDDPEHARDWLLHRLLKSAPKLRAGMVLLMQRVVAKALEANVLIAEELVAQQEHGDAIESANFENLATICEDALRLDEPHRQAVLVAVQVIDGAANAMALGSQHSLAVFSVPVLDRLVLIFRLSLNVGTNNAPNLLRWQEFEQACGLPPIERHLNLLACNTKALFLSMLFVPEGVTHTTVVVRRGQVLLDASDQLPTDHASVLLPYFESSSGTKKVQGRRVEGGEGHGPRKEFFTAASADALRRWGEPQTLPPSNAPGASIDVSCQNRSISLEASASEAEHAPADKQLRQRFAQACAGDKVCFQFADGMTVERIITGVHTNGNVALFLNEPFERIPAASSKLCRCIFYNPVLPLFEFHRGTGQTWFSAYGAQLTGPNKQEQQHRLCSFGKMLALAVANNCKISFDLPVMFFRVLLHRGAPLVLSDLQGFDDALHSSLRKILKMKQAQFAGLKEMEAMPVDMSREDYVAEQVKSILSPEGMSEVQRGFWSLISKDWLQGVSANDLRQIICPIEAQIRHIDIRRIFRVTIEDEMAECIPFVDAFWSVVDSFSLDEKRLFLLFVTGVEVPPEPGTERLAIELPFSAFSPEEHKAMLSMLPQAHTCSNTLELPNYHEALLESGEMAADASNAALVTELECILGGKLRLAIRESTGYELDAISSQGTEEAAPLLKAPSSRNSLEEKRRSPLSIGPPEVAEGSLRPSAFSTGSSASVAVAGEAASLRLTGSRGQRLILPEVSNQQLRAQSLDCSANPQDGGLLPVPIHQPSASFAGGIRGPSNAQQKAFSVAGIASCSLPGSDESMQQNAGAPASADWSGLLSNSSDSNRVLEPARQAYSGTAELESLVAELDLSASSTSLLK